MVGVTWVEVEQTNHANLFVQVRNLNYDVIVGSCLVDMNLKECGYKGCLQGVP